MVVIPRILRRLLHKLNVRHTVLMLQTRHELVSMIILRPIVDVVAEPPDEGLM